MRKLGCLVLILTSLFYGCAPDPGPPRAVKGVLDLSGWEFKTRGPARLDGEWAFEFNRLLEPEAILGGLTVPASSFYAIPGLWAAPLPDQGYATYRLLITGIDAKGLHAVYVTGALSVAKLWVNGRPAGQTGRVGPSKSQEGPHGHSMLCRFDHDGTDIEIILQVSNFRNMRGGANTSIWLGPDRAVQDRVNRQWVMTAVLGSALVILGLYHLALYAIRRKILENCYFGLYCILWAVQILFGVSGGCLMASFFPALPWNWTIYMTLVPYGLTTPLAVMFYHRLFPNPMARKVNGFFQVMGGIYLTYLMLTPPNAYDTNVLGYILVSLASYFYLFCRFVPDLKKGAPGAAFLIPGYLLLALTGVNDVLYDLHLIHTGFWVPLGTLGFIMSYSFLISLRFSKAFDTVERLRWTLEQQNRELKNLDRLKERFLANTSHELKTPLNNIMGMARSLADHPLPAKVSQGLYTIDACGRRLSLLINDLLDTAGLRKGRIRLNPGRVCLRAVVDAAIRSGAQQVNKQHIVFQNRVPEDFPCLICDEYRLHQILAGLVGNAVKFTHNGRIRIGAAVCGARARIYVKDTGVGIPKADQIRIFHPFERAEADTDMKAKGTGLGLAIIRDLVRLHSGDIRVKSRRGKGSVFWFSLPLTSGEEQWAEGMGADHVPDPGDQEPARGVNAAPPVMVVDSDPVSRQVLANHLTAWQMRVTGCAGGSEALAQLKGGFLPDLILMDLTLPEMDGIEVCRRLRKAHSPSELPIILLTARHRIRELAMGFEAGANDYLAKPFEKSELRARVETQLSLARAYGALKENTDLKEQIRIREKREAELERAQEKLAAQILTLKGSCGEKPMPDRRNQAVTIMNLALDTWTRATRTSRVELAEASGLWNVYIGKDGWARTQTLDKYLSTTSLPAKPRWKNIINTADFVLANCPDASPLQKALSVELEIFRRIIG